MKTATRRTSVSSTERWSTVTPSSRWWPSSKPWPASRSTTAALQEWWDVHTRTSPGPRTYTSHSWRQASGSRAHVQTPKLRLLSWMLQHTDERPRLRQRSAAAAHRSSTTPRIHHPQSLFPCSPSCSTLKLSGTRARTSFSAAQEGVGLRAECCYQSKKGETLLYSVKTTIDTLQIQ